MVELLVYDRWGEQRGTLSPLTCTRSEEVNGEDSLTFTTTVRLEKGDRILFQDDEGAWHEHVVCEIVELRESGNVLCTYIADNSLCETIGDYLEDVRNQGVTASTALSKALSPTRWTQGATSALGTASQNFYHTNARAAINAVAEAWGGEVETEITVGTKGVTARKVSVRSRLGINSHKRFEYKKDLVSIKRTVEADDVVTALYGYGAGLAATDADGEETGGFSRKITFGDINGGKNYVEDSTALALWGRPDGAGGKAHVYGDVEFPDCEDARELLTLTRAELPRRSKPVVTYEATVQDFRAAGFRYEGFGLGDDVQIIDWSFTPALELQGRILAVEWNYRDHSQTKVTLGNITPAISDQMNRQAQAIASLRDHSGAWDKAASADQSYINGVIGVINDVMNATGGYVYMEPGEGITVYDRPADQNPTMAINLNGAGFRIANSRTGDAWNWRTFGTGDGFTADELNAGIIKGGSNWWNLETGDMLFKQGGIRDSAGKNSWDLGTGEFKLSASATIGGKTASKIAKDAVDSQTQLSIFNKLTDNGKTQGIYLSNGLLYINATYLKTGTISDQYGRNTWNLNTGTLATNYMTANNITAKGTMESGYDTSYKAKMTGGYLRFFYNGAETIEMVSIPAYTSGAKGGYIQACNGATYLGLRAPHLYTAENTSEAGTIGYTGTVKRITDIEDAGNGSIRWWWNSTRFINGICVSA